MPSQRFVCHECGVHFGVSSMAWEAVDLLVCPHCGGVEIEVDLEAAAPFEQPVAPAGVGRPTT
jgi:Zn-finger nucleic acid-binding protein